MKNKLSAIKLEHDSYISLHIQLHNQLRQLIVSGRWQSGERLPSESQLAKHLDISRTTVRIALQRAEVEGLIKRTAGRGTFVSYNPDEHTNTRFVGFVTRSFHNELHRILLSSVETELRSAGISVIFSNATNNEEEVEVLNRLLEDDVSGLILWPNANPTDSQKDILRQYQAQHIPIVFVDRNLDDIETDFVTSDNFGGAYTLVKHLIELGHQDIVHLTHNTKNLFPIDERYRGYKAAIEEHGLQEYDVWKLNSPHQDEFFEADIFQLLDDSSTDLSAQIIKLMDGMETKPTAIACVNDALAMVTMKAIRQLGYKVPEDISIVGFDDINITAYMDVPLTTVSQNAHKIGQIAAQMLLERLDGSTAPPQFNTVPTRLQIRKSTTTSILENQTKK